MNKSTSMSIILAVMMATSGFAIAQVPATDNPLATKGDSSAPLPNRNVGNANARADVKAGIAGTNTKARTQGESTAPTTSGPGMANSRADVKAQIGGDLKSGTQGEATPGVTTGSPSAASVERKAKRAERRAAAKAKRAAAASEVKTQ